MGEGTTLTGTVQHIIYQNDTNGYAVFQLMSDEEKLETVVGHLPSLVPGEKLVLSGSYTRHPRHGEQFSAQTAERSLPDDPDAMFSYLSSGAIRGLGPATAEKLIAEFGVDVFDVLERDPARLTVIRGITLKRAMEMGESFQEQMGTQRLLQFLARYELPASLAAPLLLRYGGGAVGELTHDPYLLVGEEYGVPFQQTDEIALSMGFAGDAPCRTEAALRFELLHNEKNGHVFLPQDKLLAASAALLNSKEEPLAAALSHLLSRGELIEDVIAGYSVCYLPQCYEAETYAARRLNAMLSDAADVGQGALDTAERIERELGITYSPLQREAIALAAERKVLILTGGPGTGKTTTLRGIVALFHNMGLDVRLAAPTGRAAKRMGELCGCQAQTVHRMLGMSRDENGGAATFTKCEKDPIAADALIVDETSMMDVMLLRALLAAMRPGCRLVLVGDPDQLPSVGPGQVFSDLIRSGKIATVALTEVFRQAKQSDIVRNAHCINRGEPILWSRQKNGDCFFLSRSDGGKLAETIVELCRTRLPEKMGIPPQEIQVLTPTRRGTTGSVALNRVLQAALNPPSSERREVSFGTLTFREGDRVMQIRNDYDIPWEQDNGESGMGIFNGDVGQIVRIDPSGEQLEVRFEERTAQYLFEQLGELEPAYAITVHKAQGSEYRAVIFAAFPCAPMLMARSILYTGVTRARELLIVVGDAEAVRTMAANDRRQKRFSGLRRRLADFSEADLKKD